MSLWTKEIDDITFDDVDTFCQQKIAEGPRLDYKGSLPRDLAPLVAALANTFGGLIVLGVDAVKTNNQPVLPIQGMSHTLGVADRIVSICQDGIYPPVRPEISNALEVPSNPGHNVLVVKIPESPEAPHATDQGRKVYERTGNQNRPYDLAQIDRIEHLLNRRRKHEEERERLLELAHARSERLIDNPDSRPVLWTSVIALYPWRFVCDPVRCYQVMRRTTNVPTGAVQRAPYGAVGVRRERRAGCEKGLDIAMVSVHSKGQVFASIMLDEIDEHCRLHMPNIHEGVGGNFRFAQEFFDDAQVEVRWRQFDGQCECLSVNVVV